MNPVFVFCHGSVLNRYLGPLRRGKKFLDGARSLTLVSTGIATGFAAIRRSRLLDDAIAELNRIASDLRLGA